MTPLPELVSALNAYQPDAVPTYASTAAMLAEEQLAGRLHLAPAIVATGAEYAGWFTALIKDDLASATQVAQAVAALREEGPALGRPLVDRIQGSRIHHLKELRPGSGGQSGIRVLLAFDPARSALLLLGGDKAGN
jgi:hypothetical protein